MRNDRYSLLPHPSATLNLFTATQNYCYSTLPQGNSIGNINHSTPNDRYSLLPHPSATLNSVPAQGNRVVWEWQVLAES
ncbi:MAG: hypothetical protein ACK5JD_00280 [Mangrovibacterium sp.]